MSKNSLYLMISKLTRFYRTSSNAKNIIYSQIGDYGWSIGYLDFIKMYRRISKWPDFSKGSFVKNYTLAALSRKIGKYV